jgi:restriction system protein
LIRSSGKTMQVLEVDGSGVRRVTTGGTTQRITIATFRWVIDRLLAGETVSRREIHERNARQVSSGVLLILSQVPLFELVTVDGLKAIRMRTQLPRDK